MRLFTEITDSIEAARVARTIEEEVSALIGGATVTIEAERHWSDPYNYELMVSMVPEGDPVEALRNSPRPAGRVARLPRRRVALRPLVDLEP